MPNSNKYMRAWSKANKEKRSAINARYYKAHKKTIRLSQEIYRKLKTPKRKNSKFLVAY